MIDQKNWDEFISLETQKNYFQDIKRSLMSDHDSGKKIYPKPKDYFKAFELCPYERVKVVILGQDPYHSPETANGLAFSVNENHKLPPSLKNIFKEIYEDIGIRNNKGDLTKWAKQGVLLLNASLSVIEGIPSSHSRIGWQIFTDRAVQLIQKKKNIIFMLWGSFAKQKKELIDDENHILEAAHPSPFSANNGFFGCKHFSKANQILINQGLDPIDWSLE
tara:strand:- start:12 stop:671 length:660 start_codon:yes stop_codon:yes gene_type:complete